MNHSQPVRESRELHPYYRDGHSRVEVTDFDKRTVLYIAYRTSSKPHLTLCRVPIKDEPERLVGQVSYHHFKSKIDLNCVKIPINMEKAGLISSNFEVRGPGIQWTWGRHGATTSNLKLTDANAVILANLDNASWSAGNEAKLQSITGHHRRRYWTSFY